MVRSLRSWSLPLLLVVPCATAACGDNGADPDAGDPAADATAGPDAIVLDASPDAMAPCTSARMAAVRSPASDDGTPVTSTRS